jgi:hypothetical protein
VWNQQEFLNKSSLRMKNVIYCSVVHIQFHWPVGHHNFDICIKEKSSICLGNNCCMLFSVLKSFKELMIF